MSAPWSRRVRPSGALMLFLTIPILLAPWSAHAGTGAESVAGSVAGSVADTGETREETTERVASLRWVGVESVDEGDLEAHVFTRRRGWRFWRKNPPFLHATLVQDVDRIRSYYRNQGFYDAKVRYELVWAREERDVEVTFQVDEGTPVRIGSVDVTLVKGARMPDADLEALVTELPLKPGAIFRVSDYRAARSMLLRHFADRGRPSARLESGAEVDLERHRADVSWQVVPGPPVRFGEVVVTGLENVDRRVVLRELRFSEGEPYSLLAIERTRQRLLDLELFRVVVVEPKRGEEPSDEPEQRWPIEIELVERKPRTVSIGVGWGSEEQFRGSASWLHRNFLGDARRLRIAAGGSRIEQRASARLLQPYVFGTRATGVISTAWVRRDRDSYTADEVSLRIGPKRNFGPYWSGEVAYRFGWTAVSNVDEQSSDVLRAQQSAGLLSGFDIGARFTRTDVKTDPTRGAFLDLRLAPNTTALGSDWDYVRFEVDVRGYVPLWRSVAALRVRTRAIDPFGSTDADEVPLAERLFLGGPHSGRGFSFEKLGPLNSDGDPVGGTTSLLTSFELRIPVVWRLSVVGFIDVGQVNLEPFQLNRDQWGVGVGPGFTLSTPVGPLAFYAGYPIEPVEQSQQWRFYFAVGHAF